MRIAGWRIDACHHGANRFAGSGFATELARTRASASSRGDETPATARTRNFEPVDEWMIYAEALTPTPTAAGARFDVDQGLAQAARRPSLLPRKPCRTIEPWADVRRMSSPSSRVSSCGYASSPARNESSHIAST